MKKLLSFIFVFIFYATLCYGHEGPYIEICKRPLTIGGNYIEDYMHIDLPDNIYPFLQEFANVAPIDHCFFVKKNKDGGYVSSIGYFGGRVGSEENAIHRHAEHIECEIIMVSYAAGDDKVNAKWSDIIKFMKEEGKIPFDLDEHNCCTAVDNVCKRTGFVFPFNKNTVNFGCGLNRKFCCNCHPYCSVL